MKRKKKKTGITGYYVIVIIMTTTIMYPTLNPEDSREINALERRIFFSFSFRNRCWLWEKKVKR